MESTFKILLLEDVLEDFELVKREVRKSFPNVNIQHVDNESDFREELEKFVPDLILSDYNLPRFTGLEALKIVRERNKTIPFIVVTGSINEYTAVDCIKAGATDYIIKENLLRLTPAIKSAIENFKTLKEKEKAEKAHADSEKKFRHSFDYANIGQALIGIGGKLLEVNPKFIEIFKLKKDDLELANIKDYVYPKDQLFLQQKFEEVINGEFNNRAFEIRLMNSDFQIVWGHVAFSIVRDKNNQALYFVLHVQDITPRINALEKNRKLSMSVEQSPVSIIITDTNGVIEYANQRFIDVTQYNLDEIIGNNPRLLKSGIQDNVFYQELWDTINSGQNWRGEICNKKKNGELFWENAIISPIKNDANEITHFVSIKEDITVKKKLIDELIVAKEQAEESDRLKSAFLASMSHEIRTPLNAIVGFSSLIAENSKDPKFADFAEIIGTQNDLLLHMINDIIEFAKMEAQKVEIIKETFDLNDLINELYLVFSSTCNPAVELIPKMKEVPVLLNTDKYKLNQVFTNLISNAIKFTEQGSIKYGYKFTENNTIQFFVRDSGIGISEDSIEEIFKRFTKLDSFSQGVGLGLSIVKNILDAFEGRIWVESKVGEGTSFYFEFPLDVNDSEKMDIENVIGNGNGIKTDVNKPVNTILVAEDNESNFLFIEELFSDIDINILHAVNGQEAVDFCKSNKTIDLVLMDIKMPIMNGYEATKQIKELYPELPVIAQTAFALPEDQVKALEAGCDNYISKPINKTDLFKLIKGHLD